MGKRRSLAATFFVIATLFPTTPGAHGLTEDQTREAFLKSKKQGEANATPKPSAHPASTEKDSDADAGPVKKHPKKRKKAKPKVARKKHHPVVADDEESPHPSASPSSIKKPQPEPKPTQGEQPLAPPALPPVPKAPEPAPTPPLPGKPGAAKPAPSAPLLAVPQAAPPSVLVEKSGANDNDEPEPTPTPEPQHGWSWWPFGHTSHYKYLTPAVRAAIDRAPVPTHPARWRYIVVHNSGTRQGNAKAFNYYHLHVRKMPNGLAYQFVIGNGTSSGNGAVEVGPRWVRQINGGHVHSDYLNSIALGICLVGDFNHDKPTPQQLEALEELIRYLRNRVGKTNHKPAIVKAHKEINPARWPTDCPGNEFPYKFLTRFD